MDEQLKSQSRRFLVLYALAVGGGSAAYAPFLTIILPVRASEIAGENSVQLLSSIAFLGAIAASAANLFFGWASDRSRNRLGWIVGGLVTSGLLLIAMGQTRSIPMLLTLIVAWQLALNMMLNPLAAWAGDCVPDHQKGTLGGLLSLAPGMGAMVGVVVTLPGLVSTEARPVLIAGIVAAMVLPAVVLGQPHPMPSLMTQPLSDTLPRVDEVIEKPRRIHISVWRMWLARLLVQIAEAALFAFLLIWLQQLDPATSDNTVATIFTAVLVIAVPFAIAAGRWSDKMDRPIIPLIFASGCAAIGLLAMAAAGGPRGSIAGYAVFGVAAAVFLALHSSQTLRVLPRPENRGRDLGWFNLTNTVPSLIMPGLALTVIPLFGFRSLFIALTVLVVSASLLLLQGIRAQ